MISEQPLKSAKQLLYPDVFIATGFGVGLAPAAPGTWGSLAALLVWWFWLAELSTNWQLIAAGLYFLVGWLCSSLISKRYGVADAPEIVADEIAGMWLALALLPQFWWAALAAFALFRWLDIAKPGPIGWLDREVKGGLGVMLDDVVAGLITGAVLYFSLFALARMDIVQL